MIWKLAFEIAITHLVTKKKQSLVAMLGVMFGISMFIVMISFMTGVNGFMQDMALDGSPHVRVYNPIQVKDEMIVEQAFKDSNIVFAVAHQRPKNDLPKVKNAALVARQIEQFEEVQGVAPQVSSQVFFNNGPIKISGTMNGIDVEKQKELFGLENKMELGSLTDLLKTSDAIILGKGLAKKMDVKYGEKISITTPEGYSLMLKVVGIFAYGIGSFDESKSFASLTTVQKVLQKDPSYITDLHVKLKDYGRARSVAKKIKNEMSAYTEDWQTANSSLFAGDKIRNVMTGVISFTLLLVAGFGIYNIMNMNIINKMKDIAILKATGFQGADIKGIFLLQSIMIGITGGVLGVLMGYGLCSLLDVVPFPEGDFMRMKTMPVNFDPKFYIAGLCFGVITTLFAGWFPSRKAAKVDPVKIIRG